MSNIIDKIRLSGTDYTLSATTSGVSVVEVTQAEYDALPSSAKTDTSKMYVITDAEAGDLTNYYTKTETNTLLGGKADTATTYTKTEVDNAITAATSTKQDTLVSSENIKTINNISILGSGNINIQGGGGKAIEAGRGITITTGETADTVSFNLPISGGTGANSIIEGNDTTASGRYSHAEGNSTRANGTNSHAEGSNTTANGNHSHAEGSNTTATSEDSHSEGHHTKASGVYGSHAEGRYTIASGVASHAEGYYTEAKNNAEHASGWYNVSSSASTTFGDSGNTLFSVGNGTSASARHNAFEIRQNGDIYLSSGGTDIKLQDHLGGGGSITVDSTLDSGSTNPVENQALYGELRINNGGETETTLRFEMGGHDSTNYPNGCTKLKVEVVGDNNWSSIDFYNDSQPLGNININNWGSISVDNYLDGATYEISGTTLIISYPTVTNVIKIRVNGDGNYVYKAVTTGTPTALKDQVVANTTALGGLKLQQISQSDYDNLSTKDNNTLYVII